MLVELILTDNTNSYIIKNFYPLYLHDLSHFDGSVPNRHGILEESDVVVTLADQFSCQNAWWENPGTLFPYLIMVDSKPAGFALISSAPYCYEDADFTVHEYFIANAFRRKGIGKAAAVIAFEKHRGKWSLHTHASARNQAAQCFWRTLVNEYTSADYSESMVQIEEGQRVLFSFNNQRIM